MPVTYDLDPHTGVIHARAVGRVAATDLIGHFDVLEADDRLPARVHLLLDLRQAEALPAAEEIGVVMHKVERLKASRGLTGGACAIVYRDTLRSTALLIETYVASHFAHTQVFAELREAEDWLASHR